MTASSPNYEQLSITILIKKTIKIIDDRYFEVSSNALGFSGGGKGTGISF